MPARQDFDAVLQARPIGRYQVLLIIVCGVVAMVDGFDTQSIALAAPEIASDFHVASSAFGPVFGVGLFGGLVGALTFGVAGDRFGRKPTLLVAMAIVLVASFATPFTSTTASLSAVRFVTGIGLGGALPGIISITSEYAPPRARGTVVAAMFCGFPLGAVVGGLASAQLIPAFGWTSVFWVGGAAPVLLLPVVAAFLPESVRFLVRRHDEQGLRRVLRRLGEPEQLADHLAPAAPEARSPLVGLFTGGRALGTVLLWVTLTMSLLLTYFLTNWIPILARQNGIGARSAILGAVALNLGSIVGALVLGRLADRGNKALVIGAGFVLGAVAVAAIGQAGGSRGGLLATSFLAGVFTIGAQLCTVALCASYYSDPLRATGVGSAVGISRTGAIAGPVLGGVLIAAAVATPTIFLLAGAVSLVAAAAVLAMGRFVLRGRPEPRFERITAALPVPSTDAGR